MTTPTKEIWDNIDTLKAAGSDLADFMLARIQAHALCRIADALESPALTAICSAADSLKRITDAQERIAERTTAMPMNGYQLAQVGNALIRIAHALAKVEDAE